MKKILLAALPAILLLNGCQTYQPRATQVRQTEDQLIAQENQRRMAGRIESLEMEIARISREVDASRQAMESRFAAIEQKAEADKRDIINRLTTQLEKLLAQQRAPVKATSSQNGTVSGFEHIVRQGETLSTIAHAYDVTTKVIIDSNQIKNPDRLSIGQKIFIPE